MTPDINRPRSMESVLLEIDQRPFLNTVAAIVGEVSPSCDVVFIRDVMRKALRCACLLDLFAETRSPEYLTEFVKQRTHFYRMVPARHHVALEKEEYKAKQFFEYESALIHRIKFNDVFSWADIHAYVMGKSSDNLFYGKLIELMASGWTPQHTNGLRIQTILYDIGKDLIDYPYDVTHYLPNFLYFALTTRCPPKDIPRGLSDALQMAQEVDIAHDMVTFAALYREQVSPQVLGTSPLLNTQLENGFEVIKRGLRPFT